MKQPIERHRQRAAQWNQKSWTAGLTLKERRQFFGSVSPPLKFSGSAVPRVDCIGPDVLLRGAHSTFTITITNWVIRSGLIVAKSTAPNSARRSKGLDHVTAAMRLRCHHRTCALFSWTFHDVYIRVRAMITG